MAGVIHKICLRCAVCAKVCQLGWVMTQDAAAAGSLHMHVQHADALSLATVLTIDLWSAGICRHFERGCDTAAVQHVQM
jgi:Fe-S-cluster-containing hydrogenase component 2